MFKEEFVFMKIEKLTENKIRVIIPSEELGLNTKNITNMQKAIEMQEIFLDILKKAEKEVDFQTDGCKLLIEAFSSSEDVLVFTITKYLPENDVKKKKLVARRRSFTPTVSGQFICQFDDFDTFCSFCNSVKCVHKAENAKFIKNTVLYLWKDVYYLVFKTANINEKDKNFICSTLSEFGKFVNYSDSFENKLLEHGNVIIKKNAVDVGMKLFVD